MSKDKPNGRQKKPKKNAEIVRASITIETTPNKGRSDEELAAAAEELAQLFPEIGAIFTRLKNEVEEKAEELKPYIIKELKKARKDKRFNNLTIDEVIDNITPSGVIHDPKSRESIILERAIEAKRKHDNTRVRKPLPQINNTVVLNDAVNNAFVNKPYEVINDNNNEPQRLYKIDQKYSNEKEPLIVCFAMETKEKDLQINGQYDEFSAAFDNALAAISLRNEQNGVFTPFDVTRAEIWRVMTGTQDSKRTPTPEQDQRIAKEFEKARLTNITGDISKEIEKHDLKINDERITGGIFKANRIYAKEIQLQTEKGRFIDCIHVFDEPIILTYNKAKGRVLFLPLDILNTAGNEGNTIEIRNYLLHRIILMHHRPDYSNRILYETMYQNGIQAPAERIKRDNYPNENWYKTRIRNAKQQDREKVREILDAWKEKQFILDYNEVQQNDPVTDFKKLSKARAKASKNGQKDIERKKGLPFIGVDIEINPNAPQLAQAKGKEQITANS